MFLFTGHPQLYGQLLFGSLKLIAFTVVAPFLLILFLAAFVSVLIDFAWFRLTTRLAGNTRSKGVWDF